MKRVLIGLWFGPGLSLTRGVRRQAQAVCFQLHNALIIASEWQGTVELNYRQQIIR
jgi:hypothetical protein